MKACVLLTLAVLLASCADSHAVNAAFKRTRIEWSVFDGTQPNGLRPLGGFEQAVATNWVPRTRAVLSTDLAEAPGGGGAVAVSRLGLLLLDDADGTLVSTRPGSQWPLDAYRTDRLFVWKDRLFLTLSQDLPAEAPPASLVWWIPGQTRVAFYPVPSQVKDPTRQAVQFALPEGDTSTLGLLWKHPQDAGWVFETSSLELDTGVEADSTFADKKMDGGIPAEFTMSRARLTERLGSDVPARAALGDGPPLLFTEGGWVSVGGNNQTPARLYRLPELGLSGRYTGALALHQGYVFTWETSYRGYAGAAGLVHVPFAVLAP